MSRRSPLHKKWLSLVDGFLLKDLVHHHQFWRIAHVCGEEQHWRSYRSQDAWFSSKPRFCDYGVSKYHLNRWYGRPDETVRTKCVFWVMMLRQEPGSRSSMTWMILSFRSVKRTRMNNLSNAWFAFEKYEEGETLICGHVYHISFIDNFPFHFYSKKYYGDLSLELFHEKSIQILTTISSNLMILVEKRRLYAVVSKHFTNGEGPVRDRKPKPTN